MPQSIAQPPATRHPQTLEDVRTHQAKGIPKKVGTLTLTLTPRRLRAFLSAVVKQQGIDSCWLWSGAKNSSGYGIIGTGRVVHRVAYEWMVGPIPHGFQLDHRCRNIGCVNPHHLEAVTPSENQRRARAKAFLPAINYCQRGHALTSENTRLWSNGREVLPHCVECHRQRKERKAVRRAS